MGVSEGLGSSETHEQTVNRIGGDMAVQLMLMMLFSTVSSIADDPERFQQQLRDRLLETINAVTIPPASQDMEVDIRAAARRIVANVFSGASSIQFKRLQTA